MAIVDQREWTGPQLAFMDWLTISHAGAGPGTQKAFAEKIGVSERSLTKWKRIPGFTEEVYKRARYYQGAEVGEVLKALAEQAKTGDVPAAKLYLQVMGFWMPGMDLFVTPKVFGADVMQSAAEFAKEYEQRNRPELTDGDGADPSSNKGA